MHQQGPPERKGATSNLVIIIAVVAVLLFLFMAVGIIFIGYMATRPGGFKGRATLQETMEQRAREAGYDSPEEMIRARMEEQPLQQAEEEQEASEEEPLGDEESFAGEPETASDEESEGDSEEE